MVGVVLEGISRYYQDGKLLGRLSEENILKNDLETMRVVGSGAFQVEMELERSWIQQRNRGSKWVPMMGIMGFAICMPALCFNSLFS